MTEYERIDLSSVSGETSPAERVRQMLFQANAKAEEASKQIEEILNSLDPIEIMHWLNVLRPIIGEVDPLFLETQYFHFVIGLILKNRVPGCNRAYADDVKRLIDLLRIYFMVFPLSLMPTFPTDVPADEKYFQVFTARLQKTIYPIALDMYPFQRDDLLSKVYEPLDGYLLKRFGFTVADAVTFGTKVCDRYQRLFLSYLANLEKTESEREEAASSPLIQPKRGMPKNFRDIYVFSSDTFCDEEGISRCERVTQYMAVTSCSFGQENANYRTPLDENAICTKPLVRIDDNRYFCPFPTDLTQNVHRILQGLLDNEKSAQSADWHRYKELRSMYTENKISECLGRIFPRTKIYHNLLYDYRGKQCEVDRMLIYDNRVFIIEAKSGQFTEAARRGAIGSLRTDLQKLIEDAYSQAKRVREYIQSAKGASFKDCNGNEVLRFAASFRPNEFFLISVTLELISNFAVDLKSLKSLHLFQEDEYPWSVNLHEFEIISQYIHSPVIFTHYLKRRLSAQDEKIYWGLDELTFFAYYLENSNFYLPVLEDGSQPARIILNPSYLEVFDNYYLRNGDKPKLDIEQDISTMIQTLEDLNPPDWTEIACAILDLPHSERKILARKIRRLCATTLTDQRPHDFTMVLKQSPHMGVTVMTLLGRQNLRKRLFSYCQLKKYQQKQSRWLGLARISHQGGCE